MALEYNVWSINRDEREKREAANFFEERHALAFAQCRAMLDAEEGVSSSIHRVYFRGDLIFSAENCGHGTVICIGGE